MDSMLAKIPCSKPVSDAFREKVLTVLSSQSSEGDTMHPAERFCINSSRITHETIDGEVVIVNLASGSYYSLNGAGASIWRCLERQASLAEIVADTTQQFDGEPEELTNAVTKLVQDLQAEGLILTVPNESQPDAVQRKPVPPAQPGQRERPRFTPPLYCVSSPTCRSLLLLDPIHDVNEAGWPTVKTGAKKDGKA